VVIPASTGTTTTRNAFKAPMLLLLLQQGRHLCRKSKPILWIPLNS
jgi:hypothetical protein